PDADIPPTLCRKRPRPHGWRPLRSSPHRHRRLRCDRHVGELELLAAAHADRVVELDDLAAVRALAPELLVLEAVEDGGEQPQERDQPRDREPQEERTALDLADDPSG